MTRFLVACVQMRSGREPAANRDEAVARVREAAAAGAVYVQTPEMTALLERDKAALFDEIRPQARDETIAAFAPGWRARRARPSISARSRCSRATRWRTAPW